MGRTYSSSELGLEVQDVQTDNYREIAQLVAALLAGYLLRMLSIFINALSRKSEPWTALCLVPQSGSAAFEWLNNDGRSHLTSLNAAD